MSDAQAPCAPLVESADFSAHLERHIPTGPAWLAWHTPGKNFFKLMTAMAAGFLGLAQYMCKMRSELDPRTASELLPEWEKALSLPDTCFPEARDEDERRARIWARLSKRRWSTAQDWHDLAALFGVTIRITPGWLVQKPALYPFCYPKRYDIFPKLGRFRVYIDILDGCTGSGYPYALPLSYTPGYGDCGAFICMIERIRPANVAVIWNENPTTC